MRIMKEAGHSGKREQLGLGKGESQVLHLDRDHAPHLPDPEGQKQAGDGDPEITVRDGTSAGLPEFVVLDIPFLDVRIESAHAPYS